MVYNAGMIGTVLSVMWWAYVLIMSPFILFSGGFEEFFIGMFSILILLMLPFIFYRD